MTPSFQKTNKDINNPQKCLNQTPFVFIFSLSPAPNLKKKSIQIKVFVDLKTFAIQNVMAYL